MKAECSSSDEQSRWLPYSYGSCPRILLVEPRHVQKLPTAAATASSLVSISAALTGKHDTLVRRAPGWQGAPDGQQAKKISCYQMFILL